MVVELQALGLRERPLQLAGPCGGGQVEQCAANLRAKDAALTAAGYRVLRFTNDVDPDLAVRRLRALLA